MEKFRGTTSTKGTASVASGQRSGGRGNTTSIPSTGIVQRAIGTLEDNRTPIHYYLITFVAAFGIRDSLELVSSGARGTSFIQLAHYELCYISIALWFMLILRLLIRESMDRIARVVLAGFIIIPIVPLLDMMISGTASTPVTYLIPGKTDDIFRRFLTFLGEYNGYGASNGMKVEITIVLMAVGIYCWQKTGRVVTGVLAAIGFYCTLFLHAIIPFGLKWAAEAIGVDYVFTDSLLIATYLLSFAITGTAVAWLARPDLMRSLAADNRLPRIAHYMLMMAAGFVIAQRAHPGNPDLEQLLLRLLAPIAVLLACHSAMISNNLADLEIDRVSNTKRPLVAKTVDPVLYGHAAWVLAALALIYALAIGPLPTLVILTFLGSCWVYSMPPLRLKRMPVFSKFFIALNSYILLLLGVTLGRGSWDELSNWYVPFFLVGFTLAINFIDLKDMEGDRRAGIPTLPVLLGERWSKALISLFVAGTYLSLYFVFVDIHLLIGLGLAATLMVISILRKPYIEDQVFAVYLASVVGFIIYLSSWAPLPRLVEPRVNPGPAAIRTDLSTSSAAEIRVTDTNVCQTHDHKP